MFLSFGTDHCIKSPSANFEVYVLCPGTPGLWCPPLVKDFRFSECVPNHSKFCFKFSVYEYSAGSFINSKIKKQVVCHFFCFLIVINNLSSWLKRFSQIFLNCSNHL